MVNSPLAGILVSVWKGRSDYGGVGLGLVGKCGLTLDFERTPPVESIQMYLEICQEMESGIEGVSCLLGHSTALLVEGHVLHELSQKLATYGGWEYGGDVHWQYKRRC